MGEPKRHERKGDGVKGREGRKLTSGLRVRMGWSRASEACWVLEVWQAKFWLLGLGIGPKLGIGAYAQQTKKIKKSNNKNNNKAR